MSSSRNPLPRLQEMRRLRRQAFTSTIAITHADGSASAARATDFTANGVCFTFDSEIANGSEVSLLIPVDSQIVHCNGTVVRTVFEPVLSTFTTAVAFQATEIVSAERQMALAAHAA